MDEDVDSSLLPIPLEVQVWVAALKRPIVASIIMGMPFGLLNYFLSASGYRLLIFIQGYPIIDLFSIWVASALTFYSIFFAKPY